MLTLEDWEPLQRPNLTTRRRGRRAPKGADGAHGAASGARTAGGREADREDSGDARARAPRATDRAAGAGHESAPPVPRYNFRSGASRRRARRGEGGSALRRARRGKGGKPPRNEQPSFAPRHGRRCGHRPSKRPEASRGRAGRTHRPRASPSRGRMRERGQRPSRPDRRRRGGQRAREQLPPTTRTRDGATTPADGETAARRAATAQAGRH